MSATCSFESMPVREWLGCASGLDIGIAILVVAIFVGLARSALR